MDEPFASLNESLKRELWMLLKELVRERHLGIVLVTHDLEEAFFLGDVVSVLIDGRLHQTAPKTQLYRRPQTPDVARYLGIKNVFKGRLEEKGKGRRMVSCPALKACIETEDAPDGLEEGESILLGIRSEDVKILPPSGDGSDHLNAFGGFVQDVFDHVSSLTLHFRLDDSSTLLELELGHRAYAKLELEVGKRIAIAFRPDHVFLIPPQPGDN